MHRNPTASGRKVNTNLCSNAPASFLRMSSSGGVSALVPINAPVSTGLAFQSERLLLQALKVGFGLLSRNWARRSIFPRPARKRSSVRIGPPAICSEEANPLTAAACRHRSLYTHLKKATAFLLSRLRVAATSFRRTILVCLSDSFAVCRPHELRQQTGAIYESEKYCSYGTNQKEEELAMKYSLPK
jgi:hypothetical protein